jgi:DNA-binding NarL/FixJ family response regulator
MDRSAVLIVEDDPLAARALTQMLPRDLMRRRASSAATAIRMLRAHGEWALFLIDVGLGEGGSGLEVLEVAIAEHPRVVRVLVTGDDSAHVNNHARTRSTDVIRKPFTRAVLAPTLARVLSSRSSSEAVIASVTRLAVGGRLTMREHEVLSRLVAGEKRASLPASMRIAKCTVDDYVCAILEKVDAHDINEVIANLLRDALLGEATERLAR